MQNRMAEVNTVFIIFVGIAKNRQSIWGYSSTKDDGGSLSSAENLKRPRLQLVFINRPPNYQRVSFLCIVKFCPATPS